MIEVFEQATKLIEEHGYSIRDYICAVGAHNASMLGLSAEAQKEFNCYYDLFTVGVTDSQEKGELLEKLASSLFNSDLFCVRRNCRTSTNEIDALIDWSEKARLFGLNSTFLFLGELFLCECKNYKKSIGVTYIGKFASLLSTTRTSTGIMVSWEGVSGQNWRYGSGLIKKLALAEQKEILVVDKYDLGHIRNGSSNLLKILYEKHLSLVTDIDYQKYIQSHEAESLLNN